MARGCGGTASDELCLLVVLNTASIQLLPTTVASVRAAYGSAAPFDILPAVWVSSIASVTVGLLTARLLSRRRGRPPVNLSALILPLLLSALALYGHRAARQCLCRPDPRRRGGFDRAAAHYSGAGSPAHRREYASGLRCHGTALPALRSTFRAAGIPPETAPLMLIRPVSGSGCAGRCQ